MNGRFLSQGIYDLFSISNGAYIMQLIQTFDQIKGVANAVRFLSSFATKNAKIGNVFQSLAAPLKSP